MRTIETANIKVTSLEQVSMKKKNHTISNDDFKEKLTSFLKKKTESNETSTENKSEENEAIESLEEAEDEREIDLDPLLLLNLADGVVMKELQIDNRETTSTSQMIYTTTRTNHVESGEWTENLADIVQQLENSGQPGEVRPLELSEKEVAQFIQYFEQQGMALNVEQENKMMQLIEKPVELQEVLTDLMQLENQAIDLPMEPLSKETKPKEKLPSVEAIGRSEINHSTEPPIVTEQAQISTIEDMLAIEPAEILTQSVDTEQESQTDGINALADFVPTENRSEPMIEPFDQEVGEKPLPQIAQDDFIYELETLVIEESEALDTQEKVTTARIQLTPETLGKVDLQIEMQGKDLVARLIVEQTETKEWIEQQVAQLKEQLLTQEIQVQDFQVVVHQDNLHDALMDQQENPFFKQKQKETAERRQQQGNRQDGPELESPQARNNYRVGLGISIFV